MTITCTQHAWTAPDGRIFSYSRWQPEGSDGAKPRAVIVAVHGLSGAALDFEPLGAHLRQHGISTCAVELRGQGNDPDPRCRGDLISLEQWFADLRSFLAIVRRDYPGLPLFYYGESMGGAILVRFLAVADPTDQPAGLILASPVVVVPGKPSWWQEAIFRFFLIVRPTHRIDVTRFTKREDKDDPAKWVTRDEAHRRWFETASHRIASFTVRFFKNLFELIDGCSNAAPRMQVPTLVLCAQNDVFIQPARVEQFFRQIASRDKELELYPQAYHLLLHDHDRAEVLRRIESWLTPRIS